MIKPKWVNNNEYPFETKEFRLIEGFNLNFIDEGKGETILFVHGTPDWSYSYRNLIKELSISKRCIAIDNLGFGLSDKPTSVNYSIQEQSKRLEEFIINMKLNKITLICHDFGGPIALGVAVRNPEIFDNIIIMNSWMWDLRKDSNFAKTKILHSKFGEFLYINYGLSAKFMVKSSYYNKSNLSKENHKMILKPFEFKRDRVSTFKYAKELLDSGDFTNNIYNQCKVLVNKNIKIIWGMNDPYFKPYMLDKFKYIFPNAKVIKVEKCGHFVCEEQNDLVLNEINSLFN